MLSSKEKKGTRHSSTLYQVFEQRQCCWFFKHFVRPTNNKNTASRFFECYEVLQPTRVPTSNGFSHFVLCCDRRVRLSVTVVTRVMSIRSTRHVPPCFFFLSLFLHTPTFQPLDKPWSQVSSLTPPRFSPSIFNAHRVQQSHCLSIFHRVLLTHALALSASQFVHKKKSIRIYRSMHSAGLELTKLSYTRPDDTLIRHRGDPCTTADTTRLQSSCKSACFRLPRGAYKSGCPRVGISTDTGCAGCRIVKISV